MQNASQNTAQNASQNTPPAPPFSPVSHAGRAGLAAFAAEKLARLQAQKRARTFKPLSRAEPPYVVHAGRRVVSFACNDYLGLTAAPALRQAARAAIDAGTGAGASRLVTGDTDAQHALERELAALKGSEAALVFGSGYLANLGTIPALVGPGDRVVLDALSHACMWAGARMSGAEIVPFAHNDAADLARILADDAASRHAGHTLVMTEGVFSMDGDRAPLPAIAAACAAHGAWLLVDDAHGFGVLGGGKGTAHAFDPPVHVPLAIGTFSKASGGYGGYLCADAVVIELLKSRARPVVYSTALPPAVIAANLAGVRAIAADPARGAIPCGHATRFAAALGLERPDACIVPVVLGTPERALEAQAALLEAGHWITAIRPPTVPDGTSRLRVAFSAVHTDAQVDALIDAVRPLLKGQP